MGYVIYIIITGVIYASWLFDSKASKFINLLNILFGLVNGWLITPILIGRALAQIYKD